MRRGSWGKKGDSGVGGFSGKPRANNEGGPGGVFIKKNTEVFEKKGEVLLVRVPAAYGDNLVLFGGSGVELKDIGLDGVRNTVDLFWVGPQAGGEGFPEIGGMGGFNKNGGQEFKSFS